MKISVSSYSFKKYMDATKATYFDMCDKAKELGFAGIEFINLDYFEQGADEIELARKIKDYCEKIDLPIVAYAVGANFLCDDIQAQKEKLRHCIQVAHTLGAPVMRHDVAGALRNIEGYTYKDAIAEIVPHVREITTYAQSLGVTTCSENHGFVFQSPVVVEELINAVNNPNYRWLCDIGNFLCDDCDPVESVKIASKYVCHVHAKDFLYRKGTTKPAGFPITTNNGNYIRGTVVGHGDVNVKECIQIIKNSGYDGYVTIEFEGAEECISALSDGLANLKSYIG